MNDIWTLLVGILGSLLAMVIARFYRRGSRALKAKARAREEAGAALTRQRAAGIKGDGFAALFHLHRALHYRMTSVSIEVAAAAVWVLGGFYAFHIWWMGLPIQALAVCAYLKGAKLGSLADAMAEVAVEAVKNQPDAEPGDKRPGEFEKD